MEYSYYFDKVFGCYIGKCIGGTVGAKYEGIKQILNVQCNENIFRNMLPNDDLDLQVLWLEGLKELGENINSDYLAMLFKTCCPYSPGEYAYFKKNWAKGIHPPYSGKFNNQYYHQGMGCPIRAEIWGCISPGNPVLACKLSEMDGRIDHSEESINAEMFFASIISLSFVESDLLRLINMALDYIPESKTKDIIVEVSGWCKQYGDIFLVRDRILTRVGHPDCTNLFQNIGITVAALILGNLNFMETIQIANNCGYDTDCTAGLAASVIGAIRGGDYFKKNYKVEDIKFVLDVQCSDYDHSIKLLSQEICKVGIHFAQTVNTAITLENCPHNSLAINNPTFIYEIKYEDVKISIGQERLVEITVTNVSIEDQQTDFDLSRPGGFHGEIIEYPQKVGVRESAKILIRVKMLNPDEISDTNIFSLYINANGKKHTYSFGFITPMLYRISKPYFENFFNIKEDCYASYYDFFTNGDRNKKQDDIRNYHLSRKVDKDMQYLDLKKLSLGDNEGLIDVVCTYEDMFRMSEILTSSGPCILYLVREIISEQEKPVSMHIGCSDHLEVYFNGRQLIKNEETCWWTGENYHITDLKLKKGRNLLAIKMARQSEDALFSCNLIYEGELMRFPEHVTNLKQANIINNYAKAYSDFCST